MPQKKSGPVTSRSSSFLSATAPDHSFSGNESGFLFWKVYLLSGTKYGASPLHFRVRKEIPQKIYAVTSDNTVKSCRKILGIFTIYIILYAVKMVCFAKV